MVRQMASYFSRYENVETQREREHTKNIYVQQTETSILRTKYVE